MPAPPAGTTWMGEVVAGGVTGVEFPADPVPAGGAGYAGYVVNPAAVKVAAGWGCTVYEITTGTDGAGEDSSTGGAGALGAT